jgi:hypothetical protein
MIHFDLTHRRQSHPADSIEAYCTQIELKAEAEKVDIVPLLWQTLGVASNKGGEKQWKSLQ